MLHKWFVQWFSFPSSNLERFKYEFNAFSGSIQEKNPIRVNLRKILKNTFID